MGTRLADAALTNTHTLCLEQKYEKYQSLLYIVFLLLLFCFLSENFQILKVKFSINLNRHIFVM